MLNITNLKFNPFTPMSDLEDRISPYNINTIPGKQVMRIEKNINEGLKLIQCQIFQEESSLVEMGKCSAVQ